MAVDIREVGITPAELEPVAAFFRENRYGPPGMHLTGRALAAVLTERGSILLLVGEHRGRIVGTVGFSRMSGRRVAPRGQAYAGMFVIAPAHRSGMLAGRLFTESFERLLGAGLRGLRVEVNPANTRAFPLYVRVGFRALFGTIPDEEGYVELVSLLPGAALDLLANAETWTGMSVDRRHLDWRTISGSRRCGVEDGVTSTLGGTPALSYDFHIAPHRVTAVLDAQRCRIVSLAIDGVPAAGFTPPDDDPPRTTPTAGLSRSLDGFDIHVDDEGTLTVTHPAHRGFVLSDPLPVTVDIPSGPRRPLRRRTEVTVLPHGWRATDGTVVRDVEVSEDGLQVTVSATSPLPVVCAPWVGLRVGELTVRNGHVLQGSGPALLGIWPPDLIDFEATADDVDPRRSETSTLTWTDRASGISVTAHAAPPSAIRVEGRHLCRLTGEGRVTYDISLAMTVANRTEPTTATTPRPELATRTTDEPAVWRAARRGAAAVLRSDSSAGSVVVAPEHGVVEWTSPAGSVLASGFPARREFGALSDASAAVWVARQASRSDLDRGAEWPHPSGTLPFASEPRDHGWWITTNGVTGEVRIFARSREAAVDDELVLYLLIAGSPRRVRLSDSGGQRYDIAPRSTPWRGWTREAAADLGTEWMRLAGASEPLSEILVRSTPHGLLFAAFSRLDDAEAPVSWRLGWEHS